MCPKWKKFFSQWRKFGKSPIKQFTLKSLRLWIRNLRNPPLGWLLILTVNNLFCPQNYKVVQFFRIFAIFTILGCLLLFISFCPNFFTILWIISFASKWNSVSYHLFQWVGKQVVLFETKISCKIFIFLNF